MGKTRYKSSYRDSTKYIDGYGLETKKQHKITKSQEKRFKRAMKTNNIEELNHIDNEGLDPIDVEDELYKEEER